MGDNLPPIDLGTGRTAVAIAPGGAHTCAGEEESQLRFWTQDMRLRRVQKNC